MARYISDQNKVLLLHESGTYAQASGLGQWVGEITENSIEDAENKIEDRYLGTSSRSFGDFEQGPRDVTGTLTMNAQNFRLPFWAIGSVTETSGTQSVHNSTQIDSDVRQSAYTSGPLNPPISFTIEDSKQATGTGKNFVRTINGCVASVVTINATQGEKVSIATDYIGKTLVFSSGASTAVTEDTSRPYLWSSVTLTMAGSSISSAKDTSLEINNNIEAPHYLNNSRDIGTPFAKNRDYTLNVTLDLDSDMASTLYNDFYKTNTAFNSVLDLDQDQTTGSQHAVFTMSGCIITNMENPSTIEGATETTIEVRPQNVSAVEYTSSTSAALFNPW